MQAHLSAEVARSLSAATSTLKSVDSHAMPLLLQVADLSTEAVCIWVWYGQPDDIKLVWRIDGKSEGTLIFPAASADSGWTSTCILRDLPSDCVLNITASCLNTGQEAHTRFRTPALESSESPLRFGWGGDVCGQGYGRHTEHGMPIFGVLQKQNFDFFVLCGDLIYADHELPAERMDAVGKVWRNNLSSPLADAIGLPSHRTLATTTDEFRAKYLYLWADADFRAFVMNTPMVYALDDHEIYNNWTRATTLEGDTRYPSHLRFAELQDRGLQAWSEYAPSLNSMYRDLVPGFKIVRYGHWLDVFVLDVRSQRSANSANRQTGYDSDSYWLGPAQPSLLISALSESKAVWKVIISGAPLSILVEDGDASPEQIAQEGVIWDSVANGDHGIPSGREIELAMLLTALHQANVQNLVVLSGDVHFATAVHYDPQRAAFHDFSPFWEFVSGPLHAGGFPSKSVDRSFGAKQVFVKASPYPYTAPGDASTSFGEVEIDPQSGALTVSLCNARGLPVFTQSLHPQAHLIS